MREKFEAWLADGDWSDRAWRVFRLCLLVIVVGLLVSLPNLWFNPAKVGTFGEWAAAVGTVAAVVAALGIATHEGQVRRQERTEDEAARQRERAEDSLARIEYDALALASGVVVSQDMRAEQGLHCVVWVNVFTSDPLRSVKVSVTWPDGVVVRDRRIPLTEPGEHSELDWPQSETITATHVDPGAKNKSWKFYCDTGHKDSPPHVVVEWSDRWGKRWRAEPGCAPEDITV